MDRIIGQWHNENDTTGEIAELILQSNSIQFYRRGVGDPLCNTFIGGDSGDSNHFVVYTDGRSEERRVQMELSRFMKIERLKVQRRTM